MMDYAARVAQADTYPKLLRLNAREHGAEIALREKDFGLWRTFTWNDYQSRVHDFALGMVELGLGRDDVIGIIGDNRPDWVAAEVATLAARVSAEQRRRCGERDVSTDRRIRHVTAQHRRCSVRLAGNVA